MFLPNNIIDEVQECVALPSSNWYRTLYIISCTSYYFKIKINNSFSTVDRKLKSLVLFSTKGSEISAFKTSNKHNPVFRPLRLGHLSWHFLFLILTLKPLF